MYRRSFWLRPSVLVLVVLFSSLFLPPALAQEQPEGDFFYSYSTKVPITIARDQVGVLVQGDVKANALMALSKRFGARAAAEYPGGINIWTIERPAERAELVKIARSLALEAKGVVIQAGIVARPSGSETPMLITDQLIVRLAAGATRKDIDELARKHAFEILLENPLVKGQFLVRVTERSELDALKLSNLLQERGGPVQYAHPNFVKVVIDRETIPNDPLFGDQWHHRNTGQSAGTADADTDTSWAWDITRGAAATVIAVIDSGFDAAHPDFAANLWQNPGDTANGADDGDANTYVDDVNGWDFTGCDVAAPPANCGDANVSGGDHGTAVAGVAAARGGNSTGVSGACPECGLMLLRKGVTDFAQGLAFDYARVMGAAVITNSWGFAVGTPCTTTLCTAIDSAATSGRGGLGSVVLFAMNNPNVNDCTGALPDISSLTNVIAVSRSSNRDQFDFSGFGNCMELLAPSAGQTTVSSGRGTLWITTTDRVGANGYNNTSAGGTCPSAEDAPPPADARDYTACFNGTSSSTPLVAGIGGLVLAANTGLTRLQVQRLLQDTADKVEDSTGAYSATTGFSAPAAGHATHGWGRVNAFEAVRAVAPVAQGGKAGVDLFFRDNRLDWGNTERPSNVLFEPTRGFIGHWNSMDVKVDSPADGYAAAPTAAAFDAFVDETPSAAAGDVNRVYVRLRNRGHVTAATVNVKLHWSQFGTALAALPADFWTAFPADSTDTTKWHPLSCATAPPAPLSGTVCQLANLAYSGASVAGAAADAAQVVRFDFPAPTVDPLLANHFCLLAMADSTQDAISAASRASSVVDAITPADNNVTHRNYSNLSTSRDRSVRTGMMVRNPHEAAQRFVLRIQRPKGWEFGVEPFGFDKAFELKGREEVLVTVSATAPALGLTAEVPIVQELADDKGTVLGGVTLGFRPAPAATPHPSGPVTPVLVGTYDLRNGARTLIHLVNPTAKDLRVWVAFFDDNEKLLKCVRNKLSPDDLLEIDVGKEAPGAPLGVVKVLAFDARKDVPAIGLVGNQRIVFPKLGVTETSLHPVPLELFGGDLAQAWKACH